MTNFNEQIFVDNTDTLENISHDSEHNVSMTYSTKRAVSFDKVKTSYLNAKHLSDHLFKSCDALYSHSSGHTLIEFKNGDISKKANETRIKLADSLLILGDIKNINIISVSKNEMEFILVYNDLANGITKSQNQIHNHLSELSNIEFILFGLGRYKGTFFKDVHTYTASEFDKYIANL